MSKKKSTKYKEAQQHNANLRAILRSLNILHESFTDILKEYEKNGLWRYTYGDHDENQKFDAFVWYEFGINNRYLEHLSHELEPFSFTKCRECAKIVKVFSSQKKYDDK